MPTISMFYGILIKMFFDDHAPPHFHAEYGDYELVIAISPIKIVNGDAPVDGFRMDGATSGRAVKRLGAV